MVFLSDVYTESQNDTHYEIIIIGVDHGTLTIRILDYLDYCLDQRHFNCITLIYRHFLTSKASFGVQKLGYRATAITVILSPHEISKLCLYSISDRTSFHEPCWAVMFFFC